MLAYRFGIAALIALLIGLPLLPAAAAAQTPALAAEQVRSQLLQAQLAVSADPAQAQHLLTTAQTAYTQELASTLTQYAPPVDKRVRAAFTAAEAALAGGDGPAFAAARAGIWTGLLDGSYRIVEVSLNAGDTATAQTWLALREFRRATRFSRPGTDATKALTALASGTITVGVALPSVRADLLDTYQARLNEALHDIATADRAGLTVRRSEAAAHAEGYFLILAPSYQEARGPAALAAAQQAFSDLRAAAGTGQGLDAAETAVETALNGFRAAPLTVAEEIRRAGQLLRFLALVPVEYGRGVRDGRVTLDLEIREAITFRDGAAAAFADLQPALEARDPAATAAISRELTALEVQLTDAANHSQVAAPAAVQAGADRLLALLHQTMPPEWQQRDANADFDVIAEILDQMEAAVAAGQYDLAESSRLEAYAVLESGPEARLQAFAPDLVTPIEDLFWYGQGTHKGLAYLINAHAPITTIRASRDALDTQLTAAAGRVHTSQDPLAVAVNAAIIVFREGLEAVLILASLLGSLKLAANRRFRAPLWWGAAGAFAATVATWIVAQGVLLALARYGERLEAVVSLIAIAVLLLITNWFFHNVYWTGWIANFHARKKRIIGGEMGQMLGLVTLGFTSIYREGFETVLFLQALVLEAGAGAVLGGIALGLAGTIFVGILVFALQARLPHRKMLVMTGVLIGGVLLVMVGNTVHVLQVVGWLPTHPIGSIQLPYWAGLWFGLFPTWEGIGLQLAAAVFVIGSYFLAERQRDRRTAAPQPHPVSGEAG